METAAVHQQAEEGATATLPRGGPQADVREQEPEQP